MIDICQVVFMIDTCQVVSSAKVFAGVGLDPCVCWFFSDMRIIKIKIGGNVRKDNQEISRLFQKMSFKSFSKLFCSIE